MHVHCKMMTPIILLHLLASLILVIFKSGVERALPRLGEVGAGLWNELVSVIIPARNEESDIGGCIESYLSQDDGLLEIIVVDDGSTDATAEVAGKYAVRNVKIVQAGETPVGWVGKNWACHVGYMACRGQWLIFTDSDVRVGGGLVSRAIKLAVEKGFDMVTLYPRFEMRAIVLKAALPILLFGLYLIGRPERVVRGKASFAFGSFILMRRDAYERVGGHKRVRGAVLEDRALAVVGRNEGLRMILVDSRGLMTAAWNRDLKTLWHGMLRLFTSIFMGHKIKGLLFTAAVSFLFITPIAGFFTSLDGPTHDLILSSISMTLVSSALGVEAYRHRGSPLSFILWPLGAFLVIAAMLVSWYRSVRNPVIVWRQRRYRLARGEMHEVAIS